MVRTITATLTTALACGCASSVIERAQLSDSELGPGCAHRRRFSARFHVGEITRSSVIAASAVREQSFDCGDAAAVIYFLEFADEEEALRKAELIAAALWGASGEPVGGEALLVRGRVSVIVSSPTAPPPPLLAKLVAKGFAQVGAAVPAAAPAEGGGGALTHLLGRARGLPSARPEGRP
jgi:hypothetical protein